MGQNPQAETLFARRVQQREPSLTTQFHVPFQGVIA